jgi:hypothetical protein
MFEYNCREGSQYLESHDAHPGLPDASQPERPDFLAERPRIRPKFWSKRPETASFLVKRPAKGQIFFKWAGERPNVPGMYILLFF